MTETPEHHPTYFESRNADQRLADVLVIVDKLCFVASHGEVVNIGEILRDAGLEMHRLRQAHEWQPIETSPRDGTLILIAWAAGRCTEVREALYNNHSNEWATWWAGLAGREPTHWMPLPEAPR